MWEKAERHELSNDVCQQLVEGVGIDTTNIDSYFTGNNTTRKRSNKESDISRENNEHAKNAFIRLEESMNKLQKLETQKLIHDKQEIWFTHTSNLHHEVEGTPSYNNKAKYIKILEKQIADLQAQLDCNDIDDIAI